MAQTPKRTVRKLHPRISGAVRKHAQRVGLISWAMGNLQANLQTCFCVLLDHNRIPVGNAIWHSIKSDDGQRMMLSALASISVTMNGRLINSLLWTVDVAGKLSGLRNDAIHIPFAFQASREKGWYIVPNEDWGQPRRVERLNRMGMEKALDTVFGDLNQLTSYAYSISRHLDAEKRGGYSLYPLPRRPQPQVLKLLEKSPPKKSIGQPQRPKRKRRPPPSGQTASEADRKRLALAQALLGYKGDASS